MMDLINGTSIIVEGVLGVRGVDRSKKAKGERGPELMGLCFLQSSDFSHVACRGECAAANLSPLHRVILTHSAFYSQGTRESHGWLT